MRSLYPRLFFAAAFLATLGAPPFLAGCDAADAVDVADTAGAVTASAGGDVCTTATLSGTVQAGETCTLEESGGPYLIQGIFQVFGTIEIEPGTEVRGSTNQPAALLIHQGGQIFADGTAQAPILFTSANPVGSRNRGDWGGIIIIGRSTCNGIDFGDCRVEGLPAPLDNLTYGQNPPIVNDNSGVLRYVRIEFVGYELTTGNEINGLTLYSVGSGTTIDRVQIHKGSDDGLEFFGGTVNLKRIMLSGNSDDSIDYSYGYNGNIQFLAIIEDEDTGDRGGEFDNNETAADNPDATSPNYENEPLTRPTVYNYTIVGRYPSAQGSPNVGLYFRRGAAGRWFNGILGGFGSFNIDVDNPSGSTATYDNCLTDTADDDLRIAGLVGGLAGLSMYDTDSDNELQCVQDNSVSMGNPQLRNPLNRQAPDFRPRNTALVTNASLVQANPGGFFESAAYLGTLPPNATTAQIWYFPWTRFPAN
jgi:hypothetical protein